MKSFVECIGCGGLKRPETTRCPHCQRWFPTSKPLRRILALLGFGTLAACLPVSSSEGASSGGGTTGAVIYGSDAYGVPPFWDAGPQKTPDGGKQD